MRWPATWTSPAALSLIQDTAINCLMMDKRPALDSVAARARETGLQVCDTNLPPSRVRIIDGVWPGLQGARGQNGDRFSASPTGNPWVNSNGWKIRLECATHSGAAVWVDAPPKGNLFGPDSYRMAVADAAAHGGRWIVTLEERLAAAIAEKNADGIAVWKGITGACGFFTSHKSWMEYRPEAVVGVLSDFSGSNEVLAQEVLNLLARANQQYRIVLKSEANPESFRGLRAVLYPDADAPAPQLRDSVMAFVNAGGMLIAGPKWAAPNGALSRIVEHPRYICVSAGKGTAAIAKTDSDDPYLLANDSVVLVSHRYDLVRFWNTGASSSYLTGSLDRKKAVAHLLFYAGRPDAAAVRIAGPYGAARLWTLDQASPRTVEFERQKDAIELHLPQLGPYAAVEVEI